MTIEVTDQNGSVEAFPVTSQELEAWEAYADSHNHLLASMPYSAVLRMFLTNYRMVNYKKAGPIADRKLWDTCGNYCRVEMYKVGDNAFEVYFHDFNELVPRRTVDTLARCNSAIDIWLAARKEAGFAEQSPTHNPEAWRA